MATSALPQLAETRLATTRYLETLTALDGLSARRPSVLPGWTRAHVVAHVSRNADALRRVLEQAASGEPASMYDAPDARDHDIEATVGRLDAAGLRADAATSADRLHEAWRICDAPADTPFRRVDGDPAVFALSSLGFRRRAEVEIHHADLDLGYSPAAWPGDFSVRLVEQRRDELAASDGAPRMVLRADDTGHEWRFGPRAGGPDSGPDGGGPVVTGTAGELAWWLVGRGGGQGLACSEPLPALGRWR